MKSFLIFRISSNGELLFAIATPQHINKRGGGSRPPPPNLHGIVTAASLSGEVLLRNFNLGGSHVVTGIAHDVSILIDQEGVFRLDAGFGVGIAGAVPLYIGGEYLVSF